MRKMLVCRVVVLSFTLAQAALGASLTLAPGNVSLGRHLQTYTTIALNEPAPAGGLDITVTSSDPARLLLATAPTVPGSASITIKVRERYRESLEFWVQALGDAGQVTYTATAPGLLSGSGVATLGPSGIVIIGPFGADSPPEFKSTPRGWPTKITLRTVRLDQSLNPVEPQYVRGGMSVEVPVESSNPTVGEASPLRVSILAATDTGSAMFKPAGAGETLLSVKNPAGFRTPATLNTVRATIRTPGIAVADDVTIGENLQLAAALSLGEPAPAGGVDITLTSGDPRSLLLSPSATEIGKPSIVVHLPSGAVSATYYLQSLSRSGTAKHSADAPGYLSRTGAITLAPSGVILSLEKHGPPDEAELFRPESAGSHQNKFIALLSDPEPTSLVVYAAYLDPQTRRCADITVQPVRAGMNISVDLKNTNPAVATTEGKAVITGGTERGIFHFKPLSIGETIISVGTPDGFTTPSNSTELLGIVRP